jgi:hypothetical protein
MMKKALLFTLLCLIAGTSLWAQQSSSEGYYNLTQLSFLIAEENEYSPAKSNLAPSVVNINGYRVSEHFSLGIGIGMTALSYVIFPVFADFRIDLSKGSLSPIIAFKAGYAFANNKKEIFQGQYYGTYRNSGGAMVNPEMGFKVKMTERSDFLLTIGYWYQHVQSEIKNESGYGQYGTHKRVTDLNRLSFSISFLFK